MNMPVNTSPDIIPLGGFPLLRTTASDLARQLQRALDTGEQHTLLFANTNFIVKCQPLREAMNKPTTLIVNDGIGVDIATWLVHRRKFSENLNGTDFTPQYLHSVRAKARVFLFGGKPGIAVRAAETLKKDFDVEVVGTCDGYEQARDVEAVVTAINAANANVVLVAMGNPMQEQWIIDNRQHTSATVFIGVGALLDFLAGDKPRAPRLIQKLRLEWFYRLCLEPARLMRRYTIDIAIFLRLCMRAGKNSVQVRE
jgi:beta-1,4-glucosyltransferase